MNNKELAIDVFKHPLIQEILKQKLAESSVVNRLIIEEIMMENDTKLADEIINAWSELSKDQRKQALKNHGIDDGEIDVLDQNDPTAQEYLIRSNLPIFQGALQSLQQDQKEPETQTQDTDGLAEKIRKYAENASSTASIAAGGSIAVALAGGPVGIGTVKSIGWAGTAMDAVALGAAVVEGNDEAVKRNAIALGIGIAVALIPGGEAAKEPAKQVGKETAKEAAELAAKSLAALQKEAGKMSGGKLVTSGLQDLAAGGVKTVEINGKEYTKEQLEAIAMQVQQASQESIKSKLGDQVDPNDESTKAQLEKDAIALEQAAPELSLKDRVKKLFGFGTDKTPVQPIDTGTEKTQTTKQDLSMLVGNNTNFLKAVEDQDTLAAFKAWFGEMKALAGDNPLLPKPLLESIPTAFPEQISKALSQAISDYLGTGFGSQEGKKAAEQKLSGFLMTSFANVTPEQQQLIITHLSDEVNLEQFLKDYFPKGGEATSTTWTKPGTDDQGTEVKSGEDLDVDEKQKGADVAEAESTASPKEDFKDSSGDELQKAWEQALYNDFDQFYGQNGKGPSFMKRILLRSQGEMLRALIGNLNKIIKGEGPEGSEEAALRTSPIRRKPEEEKEASEEGTKEVTEGVGDFVKKNVSKGLDDAETRINKWKRTVQGDDAVVEEFEFSRNEKVTLKRELSALADLLTRTKKIAKNYRLYATRTSVVSKYNGTTLSKSLDVILGHVQTHLARLVQEMVEIYKTHQSETEELTEAPEGDVDRKEKIRNVENFFNKTGTSYVKSLRPFLQAGDDEKAQQKASEMLEFAKEIISYFPRSRTTAGGSIITLQQAIKALEEGIDSFAETLRDVFMTVKDQSVTPEHVSQLIIDLNSLSDEIADKFNIPSKIKSDLKKVITSISTEEIPLSEEPPEEDEVPSQADFDSTNTPIMTADEVSSQADFDSFRDEFRGLVTQYTPDINVEIANMLVKDFTELFKSKFGLSENNGGMAKHWLQGLLSTLKIPEKQFNSVFPRGQPDQRREKIMTVLTHWPVREFLIKQFTLQEKIKTNNRANARRKRWLKKILL
jgi:hypothetical protein